MTNLEETLSHIEEMNAGNETCGCDICRQVSEGDETRARQVLRGNGVDPDAEATEND